MPDSEYALRRAHMGVSLYVDAELVAEKKNPAARESNDQPLILGRDAWGGDPPKGDTPGFFLGELDDVKIWTRSLGPDEIKAEAE